MRTVYSWVLSGSVCAAVVCACGGADPVQSGLDVGGSGDVSAGDTTSTDPDAPGAGDGDAASTADSTSALDAGDGGGGLTDVGAEDAAAESDVPVVPDVSVTADAETPDDASGTPDTAEPPDVATVPDVGEGADTSGTLPAASGCPSNSSWFLFDLGSKWMHPGMTCISCHSKKGPDFAAAGTVFAGDHIADDCNPAAFGQPSPTQDLVVELTGANGTVISATSNEVGNFYISGSLSQKLSLPYTAVVRQGTKVREMLSPQTDGDCNSCHTVQGANGAPGRIVAP